MNSKGNTFDKICAYAVFFGGFVSNGIGVTRNLIAGGSHAANFIISLINLLIIIFAAAILFKKGKYFWYTFLIVCITGYISFPLLLWASHNNGFVPYLLIIPGAFGLLTSKNTKMWFAGLIPLPVYIAIYLIKLHFKIDIDDIEVLEKLLTHEFYGMISSYVFIWFVTTYGFTQIAKYVKEIETISYHDELTDLYNKRRLEEDLETTHFNSALMVDIDFMRSVNDVYGSKVGDEVIKKLASILQGYTSGVYKVYKYSGDKFLALSRLENEGSIEVARAIFDDIREKLKLDGMEITVSGGIAFEQANDTLIEIADRNLLSAKENGKNQLHSNLKKIY